MVESNLRTADSLEKQRISNGHRILKDVEENAFNIYSKKYYINNSFTISHDFLIHKLIPYCEKLYEKDTINMINSITCGIHLKSKLSKYSSKEVANIITKFIYRNKWFKKSTIYIDEKSISHKFESQLNANKKTILALPILSRKPLSPIKNNG